MPRPTSLDKYLAATHGLGFTVRKVDESQNTYYGPEVTVYVVSEPKMESAFNEIAAKGAYQRDGMQIGHVAHFTDDGTFLYGSRLILRVGGDRYADPVKVENLVFWVEEIGSRWKKVHKTLKASIAEMQAYSPVQVAAQKVRAEEEAEQRRQEREASQARVRAIKPDIRNAVWTIKSEAERAQQSYVSNLKSVISRAEELLARAENAPGYVYESEIGHLVRIAADAANAGGKLMALTQVINSELAPVFEGSTWAD